MPALPLQLLPRFAQVLNDPPQQAPKTLKRDQLFAPLGQVELGELGFLAAVVLESRRCATGEKGIGLTLDE